jgi:hypothetical protein
MRRMFIIPIVFVVLLALATVLPVAASSGNAAPVHQGPACGSKL